MTSARSRAQLRVGIDCRFVQDKYHGIGRYTFGLLHGLTACEDDVEIVAFVDPALPNSRFALGELALHPRINIRQISIPLYHPRELWAWPTAIHRHSIDVFHSPYFWSPVLITCPLVTTVHDMIFDRYPQYMPHRRLALIYKVTSRLALGRAVYVIAPSEATRRDILHFSRVGPGKVRMIPEGVDGAFRPVRDQRMLAEARQKYALPHAYVLALGARRPHKNIGRLIAAFDRIAVDRPLSLVLVGQIDARFDPELSDGIASLRRDGRLIEIQEVAEDDLPAIYSMADLFVQPSIVEGFGLPVLEAMACGCPVACSDRSSLPEVAGNAAVSFDPHSVDAIADAIRMVLESPDLQRELTRRGRERARQFTWEAAASQTLEVYRLAARRTVLAGARP